MDQPTQELQLCKPATVHACDWLAAWCRLDRSRRRAVGETLRTVPVCLDLFAYELALKPSSRRFERSRR